MPTFESKVSFLQVNIIVGEKKIENHGSLPFGKCPKAHLSNKKMQPKV